MWFGPKRGQTSHNTEQKLLKKCRKKLEVVKYGEKHGNAAAAKHYDSDGSNTRYLRKKARFGRNAWDERKVWTEISADTIINGFLKAEITEKTTTIEITTQDESVLEDIASDKETFPDELMDMIDGNGFSSESESDLLDN